MRLLVILISQWLKYLLPFIPTVGTTTAAFFNQKSYSLNYNKKSKSKFFIKEISSLILIPQMVLAKIIGSYIIYDGFITRPQKKQIINKIQNIITNIYTINNNENYSQNHQLINIIKSFILADLPDKNTCFVNLNSIYDI